MNEPPGSEVLMILGHRHRINIQEQPPEVLYKKAPLKNFAILTAKHVC